MAVDDTLTRDDVDALVDLQRARLHMRIYTDPAVFRAEIRRIFYRTWLFVAHESELPNPGDFTTTYMGLVPVIVTRDAEGALHVLVNRCLHRGTTVCQQDRGNASSFRCEYHAWTYDIRGKLIGISRPGGYAQAELDEFDAGLSRAARISTYRGLIFASFAADGPLLDEHLGLAKAYIDEWADQSPTGAVQIEGGLWKHEYRGNWKLQVEGSNEGYHPEFLHRVAGMVRKRAGFEVYGSWFDSSARGIDLGGGHSVMEFPELGAGTVHPPAYVQLLEQSLGAERAGRALNASWRLQLFPNLAIAPTNLRVIRPIAVDHTEVRQYNVALPGVPPAITAGRIRAEQSFYGQAGYGSSDDMEIFERIQEGCRAATNDDLNPYVWLNRGLRGETRGDNGERIAHTTSEVEQRAVYYAWSALMKGDVLARSEAAAIVR
jgi:phenylpropionate dioxygenase-like ring-hydroxylating dioxygenase large terminal subunit